MPVREVADLIKQHCVHKFYTVSDYHKYKVTLTHTETGDDTSGEGFWDEELGGYIIIMPTCMHTLYFRVEEEIVCNAPKEICEECNMVILSADPTAVNDAELGVITLK